MTMDPDTITRYNYEHAKLRKFGCVITPILADCIDPDPYDPSPRELSSAD